MDEEEKAKKTGVPKWASQPFSDLLQNVEHLSELLHMSMRGISSLQGLPRMISAIAGVEEADPDETATKLAAAEKHAAFAQREVETGFPVLHANAALSLWSHLEATIRLFVARLMEYDRAVLESDAIQRIRITIGEYEKYHGEDRYFYLLERLEQEGGRSFKAGVNRFESILEPLGLSGGVAPSVAKNLFELSQVRNCLMHRAGRTDRKLIDACPWLNLEMGHQVKVTHEAFRRYVNAVVWYTTDTICRIGERFGVDMAMHRPSALDGPVEDSANPKPADSP
jgi:hypothetical protein